MNIDNEILKRVIQKNKHSNFKQTLNENENKIKIERKYLTAKSQFIINDHICKCRNINNVTSKMTRRW